MLECSPREPPKEAKDFSPARKCWEPRKLTDKPRLGATEIVLPFARLIFCRPSSPQRVGTRWGPRTGLAGSLDSSPTAFGGGSALFPPSAAPLLGTPAWLFFSP